MQIARGSILLTAFTAALLSMPCRAYAQEKTTDTHETRIQGCLSKGVETGCLILTTNVGKTYSLHGNNLPGLDKKLVVDVKGAEGGVDSCSQGSVFQVTSWNWTKMKCKKSARSQRNKPADK